LRLAVISPFVDRRHGTERALAELLDRLAHRYHCEIHLYAQRVEDLSLEDLRAPRSKEAGAIFWHKVPRVPGPHLIQFLAWLVLNGLWRKSHTFFRSAPFDLVLSPGINSLRADVVLVHVLFHRLRELFREESASAPGPTGVFRRLHRRAYYSLLTALERRIYQDPGTTLAAVSRRTADLLAQYFSRSDVRVIPNAVDIAQFSPVARLARRHAARQRRNFRDADFVLLLIGNDYRVKGLEAILQSMALLRELPLRLLIVGSDAPGLFREMAKRLNVLDRCNWEVPRPDVLDFYAAADLYVSPTREDSFGLPVAEAMACGLPAITSVFAGVSSQIQDGIDAFVLRDPTDAHALAHLLQRLHADSGLRRRLGEAAVQSVAPWTWDRNAEVFWELLKEAAARKHSSFGLHGES
jgi:glycosyltransferase involved in cell wall biosynthesis